LLNILFYNKNKNALAFITHDTSTIHIAISLSPRLEPLTLRWWCDCCTTVLLPLINTLAILRLVFLASNPKPWDDVPLHYYHLAWCQYLQHITYFLAQRSKLVICHSIFSLLVPALAAGFKPLTLRWWGECSTSVLQHCPHCNTYKT
jgi:hypothetical protein